MMQVNREDYLKSVCQQGGSFWMDIGKLTNDEHIKVQGATSAWGLAMMIGTQSYMSDRLHDFMLGRLYEQIDVRLTDISSGDSKTRNSKVDQMFHDRNCRFIR